MLYVFIFIRGVAFIEFLEAVFHGLCATCVPGFWPSLP
jgi:hypothetical protein